MKIKSPIPTTKEAFQNIITTTKFQIISIIFIIIISISLVISIIEFLTNPNTNIFILVLAPICTLIPLFFLHYSFWYNCKTATKNLEKSGVTESEFEFLTDKIIIENNIGNKSEVMLTEIKNILLKKNLIQITFYNNVGNIILSRAFEQNIDFERFKNNLKELYPNLIK